jgi:hypothetical protein
MKPKTLIVIVAVAMLVVVAGYFVLGIRNANAPAPKTPIAFDPLNTTYTIDNQPVTLINGKAESAAAPGSVTKITTMIFGIPVSGDLNGDGKPDAAVMIVQEPGGSGTFYYAAAAINTGNGAQGTNAILLGDRVAPQNIEIRNGEIIANYADRNPGESFAIQPSLGVSKYLILSGNTLVEKK